MELKTYIVFVKYEVQAINKLDAKNIIYNHVAETKPKSLMAIRKTEPED